MIAKGENITMPGSYSYLFSMWQGMGGVSKTSKNNFSSYNMNRNYSGKMLVSRDLSDNAPSAPISVRRKVVLLEYQVKISMRAKVLYLTQASCRQISDKMKKNDTYGSYGKKCCSHKGAVSV